VLDLIPGALEFSTLRVEVVVYGVPITGFRGRLSAGENEVVTAPVESVFTSPWSSSLPESLEL
jgi:hypothetical protein